MKVLIRRITVQSPASRPMQGAAVGWELHGHFFPPEQTKYELTWWLKC